MMMLSSLCMRKGKENNEGIVESGPESVCNVSQDFAEEGGY